jgi:hypothetical protein
MKKQALSLVGVLSLLLVAGSAFAQAGSIQGNVPFSFTASNTTFPAGAYTISPVGTTGVILIKGPDKSALKLVTPNAVQSMAPADRTKLVFHCYGGNHCFLYQLWIAGQERGRQLPKSSVEKELATASLASKNVTIVASAR